MKILYAFTLLFFLTGCTKSETEKNTQGNNEAKASANFEKVVIQGTVFDHNGQALPQASIFTYVETGEEKKPFGAASSPEGKYRFHIEMHQKNLKTDIIYSFRSYKIDTLTITVQSGDTLDLDHTFRIE